MSRESLRRLLAVIALTLFIAAMFYPFRPSAENGILGPIGQALFFYCLMGWLFILIGVDPTGSGVVFSFFSPWPSINVVCVVPLLVWPGLRHWKWLQVFACVLALFSPVVAWRLADPVSTVPLVLWSLACLIAAIAMWVVAPERWLGIGEGRTAIWNEHRRPDRRNRQR